MIINELVTNSLKFAFPDDSKGNINIKLETSDHLYTLKISDDGIGLPEDIDYTQSKSLGLQLVNNLVKQIDGQISLDRNHGTEYTLIFKELTYKKRIDV